MTDVYRGEDIAFDLYPKTDPKNGPRIRRLTSLQTGSFVRREQKGTGVVTIVIPGDSDDAAAIDPALGHYIKGERKGVSVTLATAAAADDIVDTAAAHGLSVGHKVEFVTLTGGAGLSLTPAYYVSAVPTSTSLQVAATKGGAAINFTTDITAGSIRRLTTIAGGFLLGGNYNALSADGTKPLVLTGPGPLHYLARAAMAPHSYIGDDPQPEGVWPLHMQGAWSGSDHWGSMFARALSEMKATQADDPGNQPNSPHPNDNDRLLDPLPAITFDFDGFTDSNSVAWTGGQGEFNVQVAVEDGLRIAFRFMQAGLELEIDPDTFELRAYNTGTLGTDRSGPAWGAGIVRFQVPTNNQVSTSNVFTTAKRALAAFIQRSLVWAGRENVWGVARNASAPVRWEGGYTSDAANEAALNTVAGVQVVARTDAGDVPRLRVWAGNVPAAGQYTYGPGGHADIWDRGTVHSGTETWDWNEWEAPLSAIEWRIENPNGEFDTWVEFGSTFRALDEVMRFAGGAVGVHGPHIRLCDSGIACELLTAGYLTAGVAANGDAENVAGGQWSGGAYQTALAHGGARSYGLLAGTDFDYVYTWDPAQVFKAGVRHVVDVWGKQEGGSLSHEVRFGVAGGDEEIGTLHQMEVAGGWVRNRFCWTPTADRTGVRFRWIEHQAPSDVFVLDDLTLWTTTNDDMAGTSGRAARCNHRHRARNIQFSGAASGLEADNVQDAIDEHIETHPSGALGVAESDGAPDVADVNRIEFDGPTVTDDGLGQVTVAAAALVHSHGAPAAGFHGVLVQRTTDFAAANSNDSNPDFDTEHYDTDALWAVGSPKILGPLPASYNGKMIRLGAWVGFSSTTTGMCETKIYRNVTPGSIGSTHDADLVPGGVAQHTPNNYNTFLTHLTAAFVAAEGDTFTIAIKSGNGANALDYHSVSILFGLEVVEPGEGAQGEPGAPGSLDVREVAGTDIATTELEFDADDFVVTDQTGGVARVALAPGAGSGSAGHILVASEHATPLVFDDLLQNSEGSDLLYASE